jgi:adenine deaminase
VDSLNDFNILETYIDGIAVARNGKTLIERVHELPVNNFTASQISSSDLAIPRKGDRIRVIEALEGQLITHQLTGSSNDHNGKVVSNVDEDILKIAVINRYNPAPPALAFVKGFGLKQGAIASTVAHDSHNIIATGTNDVEMAKAINALVSTKGGICCVVGDELLHLPLPVAGLMSDGDGFEVATAYEQLNQKARGMGCALEAPFMTLSFMALLVIPSLKLSDKGLFDGNKFEFTSLFLDQI